MKWVFAFAMLGFATSYAAQCTQEQFSSANTAFEKFQDDCGSSKFFLDVTAYEYAPNKTAWTEQICNVTKCVPLITTCLESMPNCTNGDKLFEDDFRTQLAFLHERYTTLAAGGDVETVTHPPQTPAPVYKPNECTPDHLADAYEEEQAVKDACGAVFSMASTITSDPQGAGAKICSNTKCWNKLTSFTESPDCLFEGLSFMNAYKRQYASAQLACKKALGKDVNAVAEHCDSNYPSDMKMSDELFEKSVCGYAVRVASSPKKNTTATTKLCKDTPCLDTLQNEWANMRECVYEGWNQRLYYRHLTSPIMEACTALGFTVEYPNGLPERPRASSLSPRYARSVAATTLVAMAAVVYNYA